MIFNLISLPLSLSPSFLSFSPSFWNRTTIRISNVNYAYSCTEFMIYKESSVLVISKCANTKKYHKYISQALCVHNTNISKTTIAIEMEMMMISAMGEFQVSAYWIVSQKHKHTHNHSFDCIKWYINLLLINGAISDHAIRLIRLSHLNGFDSIASQTRFSSHFHLICRRNSIMKIQID